MPSVAGTMLVSGKVDALEALGPLCYWGYPPGTNLSPQNGILEMIFLFPRWDMLVPWRVSTKLK